MQKVSNFLEVPLGVIHTQKLFQADFSNIICFLKLNFIRDHFLHQRADMVLYEQSIIFEGLFQDISANEYIIRTSQMNVTRLENE